MSNIPLQYSSERKRRWKVPVLIASLVVVLVVGFAFLGPIVERYWRWRIPFLRKQTAAMEWIGPAEQIAYTDDPAEAKRLSGGHTHGPEFSTLVDTRGGVIAYYSRPSVLNDFVYPESGFLLVDQQQDVLFLHGRQSKGGDVRLVCVRVSSFFPLRTGAGVTIGPWATQGLEYKVVRPATLNSPPRILKHMWWSDPMFGEQTPKPTRIYFGTPDPVDESKFSIPFQTPTEMRVIEGKLLSDDTIQFQAFAAPFLMTPTTSSTQP